MAARAVRGMKPRHAAVCTAKAPTRIDARRYNVTRAVGTRMAKLTPSRGFAAELATSLVILVASQYGLPTSSSQCITGGIIGVALCEGRNGLNWRFLMRTFGSWVCTIALVALVTAALFAQAVFAPSKPAGAQLRAYERGVSAAAGNLLGGYSDALRGSGYNTANTSDTFAANLAVTRANVDAIRSSVTGAKPTLQTVYPFQLLGYLNTALALYSPALELNASAMHVCPLDDAELLAAGGDPCTLPATGGGRASLTPLVYGASTPPLDARKQGSKVCTSAPCNQKSGA
jgi:sodium-dependent phosphate transporter